MWRRKEKKAYVSLTCARKMPFFFCLAVSLQPALCDPQNTLLYRLRSGAFMIALNLLIVIFIISFFFFLMSSLIGFNFPLIVSTSYLLQKLCCLHKIVSVKVVQCIFFPGLLNCRSEEQRKGEKKKKARGSFLCSFFFLNRHKTTGIAVVRAFVLCFLFIYIYTFT